MWGRGREGAMVLALLSAGFQSLPPLPTIKLGPSGAASWVGGLVYILAPWGSLQETLLWGWEFLPVVYQPPQVFLIRGLRLYFPVLEIWVAWSVLLPSCSSQFSCTWMWDRLVRNLLPHRVPQPSPCLESSLPGCLSPPLLPVWMNVSSLSPWLSDFHIVQFSISSGGVFLLLFLNLLLSFFCLCEEAQCVYLHLHLGRNWT